MDIHHLRTDVTGLRGVIGMMSAPGLHQSLVRDLEVLRDEHRYSMLVSLVGDQELDYLRITDLMESAREHGSECFRFPIADRTTAEWLDGVFALVDRIVAMARDGRNVAIHCWAGRGRTGLVAAACLVACGKSAEDAISTVR